MFKKLLVIIFLGFTGVVNINADDHGDILLTDDWRSTVFINVNYQIIKKNGQTINGLSDINGWIKYNETINETFTLLLDFNSNLDWDWSEDKNEDENYAFINELELNYGYRIIDVHVGSYSRTVKIELNGNEKYILVVVFPHFNISD
jgi:hypothetical protein